MGNHRFKFSDMIPNAWFYKLKDMSKSRKQCNPQKLKRKPTMAAAATSTTYTPRKSTNFSHQPKYSYYFPTESRKADYKFNHSGAGRKASADSHQYFFPDPPRNSSKKRSSNNTRKAIYKPSPHKVVTTSFCASCSCHARVNKTWRTKSIPSDYSPDYNSSSSPFETSPSPELDFHESLLSESEEEDDDDGFLVPETFDHQVASLCSSCKCKVSSSGTDIIIDMNDVDDESFERRIKKVDLPPILTKPAKFNQERTEVNMFKRNSSKLEEMKSHNKSFSVKIVKEEKMKTLREQKSGTTTTSPIIRKSPTNPTGIRLRSNSPRIASRKVQAAAYARKSVSSSAKNKTFSESFAVVKSSVDPQKDFRDSMMEMIVENNIRAPKDLEELLACYLSLNSQEYHDLIVKAFEQIWFNMTEHRL